MTATPNAALAYRVLDHIDANPEQWHQDVWIESPTECGTAACFAGWVCLLSGEKPDYVNGAQYSTASLVSGIPVPDRAMQLLGASRYLMDITGDIEDMRDLFDERNDREDLGEFVAEIFGPRPAVTS
jgi:hypothetical protein